MTKLISMLAVTVLATGCAKKSGDGAGNQAADPPTATTPADTPGAKPPAPAAGNAAPVAPVAQAYNEERSVALVGKLAGVYEAAGTDCAKLAAGLTQFATDHKDEILTQNAWKATLSPEQVGALETRYAAELGFATKIMPGVRACSGHEGVTSALRTLSLH